MSNEDGIMGMSKSVFINSSNMTTLHVEESDWYQLRGYTGTFFLFEIVVRIGFTGLVASYGIVTNIINIIIFYRMGLLSDSSNGVLLILAISDFVCCSLTLLATVGVVLLNTLDQETLRWNIFESIGVVALHPKRMFTQTTCWITAYIAIERSFCVVFPFHAKTIFSPKRSYVAVGCICGIIIILCFPSYSAHIPVWEEVAGKNLSRLVYRYNENIPRETYFIMNIANAFVFRILSILIIFAGNFTIMWKVDMSKKFKRSATSSSTNQKVEKQQGSVEIEQSSSHLDKKTTTKYNPKETKLMRMVSVLCSVNLICFVPDSAVNVIRLLIYDIPWPVYFVIVGFIELVETFNSSINIHIYYRMSSKYKNELRKYIFKKS